MKLISVDPGKVGLGWAYFENSYLLKAGIIENVLELQKLNYTFVELLSCCRPTVCVIEVPQVYQQRSWKGDPNDLIDVAVIAGVVAAAASAFGEPQLIRPHAWKGNRPKAVDIEYTLSLLSDDERVIVEGCGALKSKLHNVIDAVGIGLWKLERR